MNLRKATVVLSVSAVMLLLLVTQAFAAVTFTENPDAAYLARTTKIDFSGLADYTSVQQLTSPDMAVVFDAALSKRTVPAGWGTWGAPPYAESATPVVLVTPGSTLSLTLGTPVKEFGLEIEPSAFATRTVTTYFKLSSDGNAFAVVPRAINGLSGSRLFSVKSDVAFDKIEISSSNSDTFAIAQLRYAFGTRTMEYSAGTGGSLEGTATQTVAYKGDCEPVTAVAAPGYHFVSWSDGVQTATRTDTGVAADRAVSAVFAKTITTASITRSPNVSSKTYTRKGGVAKFTLSAKIRGWGSAPVAGRYVYLQTSKNGSSWSNTYKFKTTASGTASKYFKITSKQTKYYRWYVPAVSQTCLTTYSAKTKITVK